MRRTTLEGLPGKQKAVPARGEDVNNNYDNDDDDDGNSIEEEQLVELEADLVR